jgi:hypothetical protein
VFGSFVYEAAINPFVPFGPLLVKTAPGWNIYLGDVPTLAFAALGVFAVALLLQTYQRINRLAKQGKET